MATPGIGPVPDVVVGRLPLYLQVLNHLLAQGQRITTSKELARRLGVSPAQIRKDLSHLGEFGRQGMGYDVAYLRAQLSRILQVDREWNMALVGAGDLGHALVHYGGFDSRGFHVVCVFDNNPGKIGRYLGRFQILDMTLLPEKVPELDIKIAIVAVPPGAAQGVVDDLVRADIRAILNYAPVTVKVPPGVQVQYLDPVIYLQRMTYYL